MKIISYVVLGILSTLIFTGGIFGIGLLTSYLYCTCAQDFLLFIQIVNGTCTISYTIDGIVETDVIINNVIMTWLLGIGVIVTLVAASVLVFGIFYGFYKLGYIVITLTNRCLYLITQDNKYNDSTDTPTRLLFANMFDEASGSDNQSYVYIPDDSNFV